MEKFMKDKIKNINSEEMLLNSASLEDLIRMKIENELNEELEKSKIKPEKKTYNDIAEVPKELIFSVNATYKLFNRRTKCETYINGIQAEALIGLQHCVREKMLQGCLGAFATDDAYVKFERVNVG